MTTRIVIKGMFASRNEKDRQSLSCPYLCTDDISLRKNPTNALYDITPLYSHYTLLQVSAIRGPSSGNTDTFCEQRAECYVAVQLAT
jgi:hypothetical protein